MEMFVMHPTAFIPTKPRPLTDIEFCAWIGQASSIRAGTADTPLCP